jgi:hypothetical protein
MLLAHRQIAREEDARTCARTFLRAFRALKGFQAGEVLVVARIELPSTCAATDRRERRTPVMQAPEDVDLMDLAAARGRPKSIEDRIDETTCRGP